MRRGLPAAAAREAETREAKVSPGDVSRGTPALRQGPGPGHAESGPGTGLQIRQARGSGRRRRWRH